METCTLDGMALTQWIAKEQADVCPENPRHGDMYGIAMGPLCSRPKWCLCETRTSNFKNVERVNWGIRRERQRVLFLAAQREMFHSMNHLAMDAGYISVGCPEGNELTFSPLSHCTLYVLLIIEYTFHTFYW